MPKFRKKPVVIEAVQFVFDPAHRPAIEAVTSFCPTARFSTDGKGAYFTIPTLEGEMRANVNDWIIRGVNGEFYPCKPDIFEKTYEPADEAVNAVPNPTLGRHGVWS